MNRSLVDLWVGIFVVLGIAALLFLSLKVGNLSGSRLSDPYVLNARFDNIGGLKVRGPIKSAGVVVGRVTEIRFDPQTFEANVAMQIDGHVRFPKDSTVSIYTSGLLGEQYIGFDAGGDDKTWAPGETITKTQKAMVLEQLIGQFMFSKAAEGKETSK